MKRGVLSLAVLAALSGCSLIPEYERPAPPVPLNWSEGVEQGMEQTPLVGWRGFFKDPQLQHLIGLALENNRDLRVAALNVQANRALYDIQGAERYPQLDANGSGTRTRMPQDLSGGEQRSINSQYSATLGLSWELDLFGRIGSLREQALQTFLASDEARRGVQISLVAEVASTYLTLQADQALLDVAAETLNTYEDSYALTKRSNEVGVASSLELAQVRTAVESARAQTGFDMGQTTPIFDDIASAWFRSNRSVPVRWQDGAGPNGGAPAGDTAPPSPDGSGPAPAQPMSRPPAGESELADAGAPDAAGASAADQPSPADDGVDRLRLSFSRVCWIKVVDASGATLSQGQRQAGDSVTLEGEAPFRLTAGDAAAVSSVSVNGESLALPSQRSGDVVRVTLP